ncbi:hypothetical protein [Rossellomorea sp. NS-SX7]|uniref:hypothetical protein n=1 Tax=Rossellomorea sp. NS-SX7 TaxID=3463856 RepID=UPI004059D795
MGNEMKKSNIPKALLIVIVCTVISTLLIHFIEKRELLTQKEKIESHFEDFKEDGQYKATVVQKRKLGDQYVLLYTSDNQNDEMGVAFYTKTDFFPLYELVRDEEANHGLLGSSFLNNEQFIVFGNVRDSGADYFQYRNDIDFEKVSLGNDPYFIQVESYNGQLSVPLIIFYNHKGEELATAPAK